MTCSFTLEKDMTAKTELKFKAANYKPLALQIAKTLAYSFLTGVCAAAGSHAYASMTKPHKGKLISINGGKQSAAM